MGLRGIFRLHDMRVRADGASILLSVTGKGRGPVCGSRARLASAAWGWRASNDLHYALAACRVGDWVHLSVHPEPEAVWVASQTHRVTWDKIEIINGMSDINFRHTFDVGGSWLVKSTATGPRTVDFVFERVLSPAVETTAKKSMDARARFLAELMRAASRPKATRDKVWSMVGFASVENFAGYNLRLTLERPVTKGTVVRVGIHGMLLLIEEDVDWGWVKDETSAIIISDLGWGPPLSDPGWTTGRRSACAHGIQVFEDASA